MKNNMYNKEVLKIVEILKKNDLRQTAILVLENTIIADEYESWTPEQVHDLLVKLYESKSFTEILNILDEIFE